MVLIGDPKQAIYAFRGGDIVTYLQAADTATTTQTLGVNWRSDRPLLDAVHAVLQGAQLGDERIVVHPVEAHLAHSRLEGAGAPFRLRVVRRAELGKGPRSRPPVALWRDHVVTDTAHDIKRLIDAGARFEGRDLKPGDIAVLAARRNELEAVQAALADVGVPSVVNAGGSVFHTPAAGEWLTLLEAMEQPHRADRVRAAALTSFFGHDAVSLDAGGDRLTDQLAARVRILADVFTRRGVAAVVEVTAVEGLTARVLGRVGGERTLTDLRHIGESLLRVSTEQRLGLVGLLAWLREQVADDKLEVASERTRRLDSDAAAVQLVTIHGSKGLQWPVVYLPTLWNRFTGRDPDVPLFHDDTGRRCRDVGGASAFHRDAVRRHWREDAGESLRLLYVAMTRAQSQVVAWYAAADRNTPDSPLHRMLLGRRPGMAPVPDSQALVDEDRLMSILSAWGQAGGPSVELATLTPPDPTPIQGSTERLAVRSFGREVDTSWRRTSYSSLSATSAAHAAAALSEPEMEAEMEASADAEVSPEELDAAAEGDLAAAAVPSPMATLPVGATFGSLVHAVLEHADPGVDDFRAELLGHMREQLVWWPVDLDPDELADALVAVCSSPLGPLAADRTLLSLGLPDRLRELDFEVPLAGGDTVATAVDVRLGDLVPAAAPPPARGRRGAGLRRRPRRRRRAGGPVAARLPHRLDRRGAARRRRRCAALPHRRLQDQLARPDGPAAHGPRLPPRGARRGDGPLRLPAPGAALHRRAPPVPALATARLRPRNPPRRGALPLPPRHVRPRDPGGRRHAVRCLLVAPAGAARGGAVRPARRGGGGR